MQNPAVGRDARLRGEQDFKRAHRPRRGRGIGLLQCRRFALGPRRRAARALRHRLIHHREKKERPATMTASTVNDSLTPLDISQAVLEGEENPNIARPLTPKEQAARGVRAEPGRRARLQRALRSP
eukprot:gene7655-10212_t